MYGCPRFQSRDGYGLVPTDLNGCQCRRIFNADGWPAMTSHGQILPGMAGHGRAWPALAWPAMAIKGQPWENWLRKLGNKHQQIIKNHQKNVNDHKQSPTNHQKTSKFIKRSSILTTCFFVFLLLFLCLLLFLFFCVCLCVIKK